MPSLFEALAGQLLTGDNIAKVGQHMNADSETTKSAMTAALPLLFGALARNASKPDGASELHAALERDHDGSVLDNLSGFLASPDTDTGNGILKHLLGSKRATVEQGVGATAGMDAQSAGKLLTMLAPLVMGALGKTRQDRQLDPSALAGMLSAENAHVEKKMPDLGGLAGLLDRDGDGSIVDDLAGAGKSLLGSFLRRR